MKSRLFGLLICGSAAWSTRSSVFGDKHVRHRTDARVGVTTNVSSPVSVLMKAALAGYLVAVRHWQLRRFVSQQSTTCEGFD